MATKEQMKEEFAYFGEAWNFSRDSMKSRKMILFGIQ